MVTTPGDPGDPFSQAPLFRELQRVLMSSPGPVNWELARQVAIATAVADGDEPSPTDADRRGFEDAVRLAELQVASATGLATPTAVPIVEAVRRTGWVEHALEALKRPMESPARRVAEALTTMLPGVDPDLAGSLPTGAAIGADPAAMMGALGQLTPLLLGAQAGTVLGSLAQTALGLHDLAIPAPDETRVGFVIPNIVQTERDWSLDPVEFRLWVALREVVHRFEFAHPWAMEHLSSLLDDFSSTLQPDLSGMRERMEGLDMADPEAMQRMIGGEEGLFGTELDEEQRRKLARVQAFLAATEGYADHIVHTLGRKLLGSYDRVTEAMRRHGDPGEGDPVFSRLLGIEVTSEHIALGRAFCDRVATDAGEEALGGMWNEPDALPSMPELTEPTLWMSRSV
jgi:putative hydrolase